MGSTGSIVAGQDNGVEVNIPNEASGQENGRFDVSMKRHHSQPASNFLQMIQRQKHGDVVSRPTANIRSSGSFDPSSSIFALPEANDKIRKEYETFKFTKDQEIQALQRKEQKLDMENNRLRAELQALNRQCQKLRTERDIAMESSYEATERATALEQDRQKIQRQFKIFRETKESEIQALLHAKMQLESQLRGLRAHGVATGDDHNFSSNNVADVMDTSMRTTSEWWAAPESEATSLFGSYAQLRNGSHVGFAESAADIREPVRAESGPDLSLQSGDKQAWLTTSANLSSVLPLANTTEICGSTLLRCYLAATPDTVNDLKCFINHPNIRLLQNACEKEGYHLTLIHFTDLNDYNQEQDECISDDSEKSEIIKLAIKRTSMFFMFVGNAVGPYTDVECQEGHFNHPGWKSSYFYLKQSTNVENNSCTTLRKQIIGSNCKRVASYTESEDGCQLAVNNLMKAVQLEFGVKLSDLNTSNVSDSEQHEVSCIDEMPSDEHMEQLQREIISTCDKMLIGQPFGFEKCYERLDEVVTSPGPVPPLLISGTKGSGKTLLLSSWLQRLKNSSPDIIILQHFITGGKSIDSDPVIMLRRLLTQLRQHLPLANQPPVQTFSTFDVNRLRETLPRWLEQFTSRRNNRILLVVDSLDLLKDAQRNFHWLLDPLHVGVRVVISVGVDSCPEEWRHIPTLHLEPLSIQSVKLLLNHHAKSRDVSIPNTLERDVVSQCRTATTCHPLYVTLLSVVACSVCEKNISENFFQTCLRSRDPVELYQLLLRSVEHQFGSKITKTCLKPFFQFLACSRNGLSETEILSLLPDLTWCSWIAIHRQLSTFCVIKESVGLITVHNSEIAAVLYDRYVSNDVHLKRCRQKMLAWLQKRYEVVVTPRNSDMLLWLLHKEEDREKLGEVVRSPMVFHLMYTRGRACEIVRLWNYLNEEKRTIAQEYANALKLAESNASSGRSDDVTMNDVAQMYQSLGRFLKDLGLMEEAVAALQKSLEILENILDPDHPAVADSLHHLASVYSQWGKHSHAEPLYRQALELVECAVGRDHLRVAQELSALVRTARKTGRHEVADGMQQRMVSIMRKNSSLGSSNLKRLLKRAVRLEELTLGDETLETAQALNDLGVLYQMQNNLDNAESFFKRSLKTREKLVGISHADVAQSYHNLAAVYNEKKQFKKSAECMNAALKIRTEVMADDDVSIIATMKYLAFLYKKSKQYAKSAEMYKSILELTEQKHGPDSVPAANAMINLAVSQCQQEELDGALPLYEGALSIYRKNLGSKSPQVYQTLRNIAVLLYQKGEMAGAAVAYRQSMGGSDTKPLSTSRW
uniref:Nephrocystin-3 n=1 Tax=Phallusia mammillata TaxID=59560 RepID=A0A6F9DN68_9ASCI|nr:nephrocystin-3-like [Phallusia mammillata]